MAYATFFPRRIQRLSRKVCDAVLEFWLSQEASDYRDGVGHAEDQARVYAGVLEALPREPAVG